MPTEIPKFRVTQAPGFASGLKFYQVGEEINWEVPDGWNDAKYGKHFAEYGPSTTFEPLNEAAKKLLKDHHAVLKEKNRPKPTADDERLAKVEEMNLKLLSSQLETQALLRRLLENQAEADEAKAKKK